MFNRSYEDLKKIYFNEADEEKELEMVSSLNEESEESTQTPDTEAKVNSVEILPETHKKVEIKYDSEYDEEKAYLFLSTLLSILLLIIPSLALIVTRKSFSEYGKKFLYKTLNFELVIILAIACVKLVPVYGHFFVFGLFLLNFISCIRGANAVNNMKDFDYPIALNFLSEE